MEINIELNRGTLVINGIGFQSFPFLKDFKGGDGSPEAHIRSKLHKSAQMFYANDDYHAIGKYFGGVSRATVARIFAAIGLHRPHGGYFKTRKYGKREFECNECL